MILWSSFEWLRLKKMVGAPFTLLPRKATCRQSCFKSGCEISVDFIPQGLKVGRSAKLWFNSEQMQGSDLWIIGILWIFQTAQAEHELPKVEKYWWQSSNWCSRWGQMSDDVEMLIGDVAIWRTDALRNPSWRSWARNEKRTSPKNRTNRPAARLA